MRALTVVVVLLLGCTRHNPGASRGGGDVDGATPLPVADAAVGGGGGAPDLGGGALPDLAAGPTVAPCYGEDWAPTVSLADLAASYSPQQWKPDLIEAMRRRFPAGWSLLLAEAADPQLGNGVDASSWPALMSSLLLVCQGETTVYDSARSDGKRVLLYMHPDLQPTAPVLATFARSEILADITDDATRTYDQTYLEGAQGDDDFTAVAEDLDAATNGLGCLAAAASEVQDGISARDGVAAMVYYLELYLRRARLAHPTVWAALQASPDWQHAVRLSWARATFWRAASAASPQLAVADAPIWAHVDDPGNRAEVERFTGATVADIACHP